MRLWILIATVAGLATLAFLSGWRKYPLELGLMSAVGVGALVFATLQTIRRLRDQVAKENALRRTLDRDAGGASLDEE